MHSCVPGTAHATAGCFFFSHLYSPASGQPVVTGVVPSSPRFLPSIFFVHRVRQSHCSSIFHRVLFIHPAWKHSVATSNCCLLCSSTFVDARKAVRCLLLMCKARINEELAKSNFDFLFFISGPRLGPELTRNLQNRFFFFFLIS